MQSDIPLSQFEQETTTLIIYPPLKVRNSYLIV
jgi:hypothetical protein